MILRRLTKHIKEQNWFAVSLDVLVVITGIFLGMQVTEWNEDRNDRIDGQDFLARIHKEIVATELTSSRVKERRLNLITTLTQAAKVVFDPSKPERLDQDLCDALATSHYLNIAISELPSMTELMSAGRVAIIEDHPLRTALIEHQQKAGTLRETIQSLFFIVHNLPMKHPNLIQSTPYYDEALGEMQSRYQCDLAEMRKDQAFLNAASENVDGFDVYLRDGLRPWSTHMTQLHRMLDQKLGISHD